MPSLLTCLTIYGYLCWFRTLDKWDFGTCGSFDNWDFIIITDLFYKLLVGWFEGRSSVCWFVDRSMAWYLGRPSGMRQYNQVHIDTSRPDDVIKRKHLPRYRPFVRGIQRSPVNSPHKGQWRGALIFSLLCARINGWVNNREAGDLRRHRAHYDVTVMTAKCFFVKENLGSSIQTSLKFVPEGSMGNRSTLDQVMFGITQVTSHSLKQSLPRCLLPYDATAPHWVNMYFSRLPIAFVSRWKPLEFQTGQCSYITVGCEKIHTCKINAHKEILRDLNVR